MDKKEPARHGRTLKIPKGTKVVPRDDPNVELSDGELSESDPRKLSPRRNKESIERITKERSQALEDARKQKQKLSGLKKKVDKAFNKVKKLEKTNERTQKDIEKYERAFQ